MAGIAEGSLPRLAGNQARATDPLAHVWLSASAGTGKTQVLAARVFRLLLRGVDPDAILALTFTKAGAAEMASRINRRLAAWVRMPAGQLIADLDALGEKPTPALQARARTLFASVLDAPGGGVRIQTIHGFCQGLLAAFPVEAGLAPGFRPLEAREEAILGRDALARMLAGGDDRTVQVVGALSRRLGEGGAEQFLTSCAHAADALEQLPSGIAPFIRRALDLPSGYLADYVAEQTAAFDPAGALRIAAANRAWNTATGRDAAARIDAWLARDPAERAETLGDLASVVLKADGDLRKASAKLIAAEPDYERLAAEMGEWAHELAGIETRGAYAELLADGLDVGRTYARAYALAKRRGGGVDFDDLIARAVALLSQPGIGDWVRYKLDQQTEHVLIDEAQDTNARQWTIVRSLVEEFFVGRGLYAPRTRTLFTVGDYKQAIFGFQGTDPINFEAAERYFGARAADVLGDDAMPEGERGLPFSRLSLTHSFRSTRPVLEFVDAAVAAVPAPGMGVDDLRHHDSEVRGPGRVTLWPPVVAGAAVEEGEESWVDDAVRENAKRIAVQVRDWLRDGLMLGSKGRRLRPEDVMILVKRRGELASLLVARLYAEGVPVAGVDRLRLNAPLGVQDLLAAVRFCLQPDDDLSLASLLVSPLIGWTQDELMLAAVERTTSLWRHLGRTQSSHRLAPLNAMLARADVATPYAFLEELLSGPLDGRRRLLLRLGAEARDPIEELLNSALAFETASAPSLQRFLDWFDRGDVEIVRDPSQPLDAVRVMTAHGAKGLQAPLVILADACLDPTGAPRSVLRWTHDPALPPIPVFRPRKGERAGPLADAMALADRRELEEHWRLFYVAATRAEEQLIVAGSLGPRARGLPPELSWYAAAQRGLATLPTREESGTTIFDGVEPQAAIRARPARASDVAERSMLPEWARRAAPQEARPARPLAPSAVEGDHVPDPPPAADARWAAERGTLIHRLLERLPSVAPDRRRAAADHWLAASARLSDPDRREEVATAVCRVLSDDRFADLFGPAALAEAPLTAVLPDGHVVAGTVDRLLVSEDHVRVIDYKTGRFVPPGLAQVPDYHLAQMAAYVAALGVIFPDRRVEAALLYTGGPVLFDLPRAMLDANKPRFAAGEQS